MSSGYSSLDWPTAAHFAAILQNPKIAFRDTAYHALKIHRDQLNQPRVWSGKFANVYKGVFPDGRAMAIRVFTSAVAERRERYDLVAKYLSTRRLNCLVRFTYDDRGIRSGGNGKWYPLVTMEWVDGETLFQAVRTMSLKGDCRGLTRLAEQWVALAEELAAANVAHGDLQHGNVMVDRGGALKLVDYDCMYVPALAGRKNLELGVDPYQHCGRNVDTVLSPRLDDFSTIFIYAGLRALAAAPQLWKPYIDDQEYEKLLFQPKDFNEPQQSALIRELKNSPDPEVRRLSQTLLDLWQGELDQVPRLVEVLLSEDALGKLLDQGKYEEAAAMAARFNRPLSAANQTRLQRAQQLLAKYRQLEQAAHSGSEQALIKAYDPLLDSYPKAQALVQLAKTAPQVLALVQALQAATKAGQVWKVAEIWRQNEPLLRRRPSAAPYEPLARSFAEAWAAVKKVPAVANEENDRRLLQVWKDSLFAGWGPAQADRTRAVEASRRLKVLEKLGGVASGPLSPAGEQQLVDLAAQLPAPYPHRLEPRVAEAAKRLEAYQQFQAALGAKNADATIARAAAVLAELKAESFVPAEATKQVDVARHRMTRLTRLEKEVPRDYRPAQAPEYDPKLLALWHDRLFCDWPPAAAWSEAHRQALARRDLLAELDQARAAGNRVRAAELAAQPCLDGYPLPPATAVWIREARAEIELTRCLLDAVRQDQRPEFLQKFDARILKKNIPLFSPYQERLHEWIPAEILPIKKLGLGKNPIKQAVEIARATASHLTVRTNWIWPSPRFTEQCLLGVCPNPPQPRDNPREIAVHCQTVQRKDYEGAGGLCTVRARSAWRNHHLVVWAVLDVGVGVFTSEPLVLGRL